MSLETKFFGKTPDGRTITAYTLSNQSGVKARVIDYGCTVVNLWVKDKSGKVADVVCGFDDIEGYLKADGYHGATVGRVCNRIHDSKFTLNGVEYNLYPNDKPNSLHGGKVGFNNRLWKARIIADDDMPEVEFSYLSPDMEENFPGNLSVRASFKLTEEGGFSVRYCAVTDKDTIVNMTNHSYFNLGGYDSGTINDHLMWLDAGKINEVDKELIPTGNFLDVTDTSYDFRTEKCISRDYDADDIQGKGYDTNYIFDGPEDYKLKHRATLTDPKSGRKMEVWTNQPCIQIYTANFVNEKDVPFKGGVTPVKNCGVCFETQKMPDSINHPDFTNVILHPGQIYDYTTVYKFV